MYPHTDTFTDRQISVYRCVRIRARYVSVVATREFSLPNKSYF